MEEISVGKRRVCRFEVLDLSHSIDLLPLVLIFQRIY